MRQIYNALVVVSPLIIGVLHNSRVYPPVVGVIL